jgi:colanic acid biosynthesis glycosyl transferase WcaI
MRISIITNYFPPEIGAASHLFYELAATLSARGHHVSVITGYPRYNVHTVNPVYQSKLVSNESIDGIEVLRVRLIPLPLNHKIGRGLDHFCMATIFALRGLFIQSPEIFLVYSPPLTLGLSGWFLRKLKRAPFVVNIQDLFPREAVELGLLKNSALIRLFELLESFIYRTADHITVHSPGNIDHIITHGGAPNKVSVAYNWVDTEFITPHGHNNEFSRCHSLTDRFVVSYAGTMGWCQDMETIIHTARLLVDYKDILFLMVGEGVEKAKSQQLAEIIGLTNIKWLPLQTWAVYPQVLAASHVCMINLNKNLTTPVVPSKLLNIMAAGRPVAASMPLDGDAPRIIAEAQAGFCVGPGNPAGLAAGLLKLYQDPALREDCGRRGRLYAEAFFSRNICIDRYENIFASLSQK